MTRIPPSAVRDASATPARAFYQAFGCCAVVFAAAGAQFPGEPSTVFLLIASYCFWRGRHRR